MADLNSCSFTGRLGGDPEKRVSPKGNPFTNFSLAIKNWGTNGEETMWLDCTVFGKAAENAAQHLRKGSVIGINGSLRSRSYEDREGIKRTAFSLTASTFSMIGPKQNAQTETKSNAQYSEGPANDGAGGVDFDDDIPF